MANIPQLISGYLDNELDDQDVELLADSLRIDSESVNQLVLHSFIHAQLTEWMSLRPMRDEILGDVFGGLGIGHSDDGAAAQVEELDFVERESSMPASRYRSRTSTPQSWRRMAVTLAASLLVVALGGVAIYRFASRPAIVAQLTQTSGCQWHASQKSLPVGTLLEDGQQLRLTAGRALITFTSGAQIVIDGPTSLRLESPTEADFQSGKITAKVPTQAIGFTVNSPFATFVDLGTEFTLTLEREKAFELQVFDGLVELRLAERFADAEPRRLRISEGTAVRFDVDLRDVATVPYDQTQRMSF